MGLEFIGRTIRTFALLLLIFFPFGLYYLGLYPAMAVLSGGIWGMLNLMFITALVQSAFRPEGADLFKTIGWSLLKFPILYAAGYAMLKVPQFNPYLLLIGFGGTFVVIVLKILGRLLLGLDANHQHSNPISGAAV